MHQLFAESPVKTHSDVQFTSVGFTVMNKISYGSQVNSPPPQCPYIVGTLLKSINMVTHSSRQSSGQCERAKAVGGGGRGKSPDF